MARTNPPPMADPKDSEKKQVSKSTPIIAPWLLTGTETNTTNSGVRQLKKKYFEMGSVRVTEYRFKELTVLLYLPNLSFFSSVPGAS